MLKKRYLKRIRQMQRAMGEAYLHLGRNVMRDVAPNMQKMIDKEFDKLYWVEKRLKDDESTRRH